MSPIEQSWQIVVPMPPNNANPGSRTHWRTKGRDKKKYFAQLDELQKFSMIMPPPKHPLTGVQILGVMVLGARMDDENAKFRCYKWPCDWLKTRGYLVDDRRPHCTMLDPIQCVKRSKTKDYYITFTISPISHET